ncbi:CRISPR-associated protein Cas4 [Sedimentibacter sp.]|uniref:CRISPR-associated protein Cas4 n=1 Tax=Sedimentibacter sp. TaxID=1960295 RepID=UPI000EE9D055|nr:CRISPR-associated protein Cas4 [Sedimentibacter sp.]HCX61049.1 CRISPR-associated protein Cas4 [Clostridiales bacterium]
MRVNGTLMNYYFHCKRQCYLHGNRLNLEDNSENVKIGKALHEVKEENYAESELEIENVKMDGLTTKYLVEIKKSDADIEASKWQVLLYLKILKEKGVIREGKLEFTEKNKQTKNIIYVNLNEENERLLEQYINEIEELLMQNEVPEVLNKASCKKCAYYEYCYI